MIYKNKKEQEPNLKALKVKNKDIINDSDGIWYKKTSSYLSDNIFA